MSDELSTYFENLKNSKHKADLEQLQVFIKAQLPEAEETLTYSMPTYMQNNQAVVAMASQKNYMSLYMDADLLEANKDEFGKLNCGKSCVRFRKFADLPLDAISLIIQATVKKQSSA